MFFPNPPWFAQWFSRRSSLVILRPPNSKYQSCREPAWGIPPMAKVMRKEARQNAKVWSGFRGSPWVFLNIYPQKPESAWFYCTVLFHSSDTLWKKLTQGFSLLHLKGVFQLKPLGWLSNLPYLDFYNYACDCLQPLNCERHEKPQT